MKNQQNNSTEAINCVESRKSKSDTSSGEVQIKRARVDSLIIYEITESELDTLINGTHSSIFLNICISSFSFFISFIISLFTASFENRETVKTVFIAITVFTFMFSVIYLIRWLFAKKDLKSIITKIKNRRTN